MNLTTIQAIEKDVTKISKDDLPREIAFAKGALDLDHPETVVWLSELYKSYAQRIGFND